MLLAAATATASVKFASKFEESMKDKRAAIRAASTFPESSSAASKGKLDLALKMAGRDDAVPRAQGLRFRFWQHSTQVLLGSSRFSN
ncbi:hypothetical protein C2845_PM05G37480 [Panicum miliaceum]|uniref:Uncharacterized protein n=1 Tax=Panicum miliaceum TaxID=4540 RepID=A0A3L6T1Q1_PANMI|nr:hypothetical protein C2845_PM05G37480 [Panicum miliaceum]